MQIEGDLVGMMTKSGTIKLDLNRMSAAYDFEIAMHFDGVDAVDSFRGQSELRRETSKPDDDWMCPERMCAKRDVLHAVLKQLRIDPTTVEFLGFDAKRTTDPKRAATEATEPDDWPAGPHDIVRFLGEGKVLGSGMFFQVLYTILFWPCG